MKKIVLAVFAMFLAGSVFCQAPLDKDQEKKVKNIHKNVSKEHEAILNNTLLTVDEKKARVDATKNARDAQLASIMTSEQAVALKSKDTIDWNKVHSRIEKMEKARLKGERDQKLKEVDQKIRDIDSQQDEIKKQQNELKRRQKDLDDQRKLLKTQRKGISDQYK